MNTFDGEDNELGISSEGIPHETRVIGRICRYYRRYSKRRKSVEIIDLMVHLRVRLSQLVAISEPLEKEWIQTLLNGTELLEIRALSLSLMRQMGP